MFIENLTKQKLKHPPAYADILKVQAQKETGPSSHAKQDSLYQNRLKETSPLEAAAFKPDELPYNIISQVINDLSESLTCGPIRSASRGI